jgi:hypothetical protein
LLCPAGAALAQKRGVTRSVRLARPRTPIGATHAARSIAPALEQRQRRKAKQCGFRPEDELPLKGRNGSAYDSGAGDQLIERYRDAYKVLPIAFRTAVEGGSLLDPVV